jgi:hypothetical protein
MGNVNSSVEGTDSFFSSSKSVKVPKHLQPLKRKPTSEKPERGKAKKEPESTQVTFQRQKAFMHEDKHPLYREQLESGPPLRTNLRIERHEVGLMKQTKNTHAQIDNQTKKKKKKKK